MSIRRLVTRTWSIVSGDMSPNIHVKYFFKSMRGFTHNHNSPKLDSLMLDNWEETNKRESFQRRFRQILLVFGLAGKNTSRKHVQAAQNVACLDCRRLSRACLGHLNPRDLVSSLLPVIQRYLISDLSHLVWHLVNEKQTVTSCWVKTQATYWSFSEIPIVARLLLPRNALSQSLNMSKVSM